MTDRSTAFSLLGGIEFDDPRLYDLINILIQDFYTLNDQINPPTAQSKLPSGAAGDILAQSVLNFVYQIYPNNVRLTWDLLSGASYYEIKYRAGVAIPDHWDTSDSIIQTSSLAADVNPIAIPLSVGKHSFLIKGIGSFGIESAVPTITVLEIYKMSAPTISAVVIDNNVLLSWIAPLSQLEIQYYNIYKGGVKSGTMKGTFEAIFEIVSGTYTYGIEAIDFADNASERGTLSVAVKQPPDYSLQAKQVSLFNGTKVNCANKVEDKPIVLFYLLVNVNRTENWGQHFSTRSWANIKAQIDAGYPIYIQPTPLTGSYEEVFDFGVVLNNNIVTVKWSEQKISPEIAVVCKIAASTDGVNYTAFVVATSYFFSSLRYVKVRLEFTGTSTTSLSRIYNLEVLLDVKRETDSGQVTALAVHGQTGTQVYFNKVFKDIDAIELTVSAKQPITAIYNFIDIPNPTHFFVLAYDSSGNQVDYLVSWMARGVV